MEIIIGLVGAKGAGKTTAYNIIKASFPGVEEITLAGKLKDGCALISDVPRNHFDAHEFKENRFDVPFQLSKSNLEQLFSFYKITPDFEKHIKAHIGKVLHSPREIAQYVGTEVLRNYYVDIHCSEAIKGKVGRIGVVTDMRFPSELNYFKNNFPAFQALYIKNTKAEIEASKDTHASEAYLQDLASKSHRVLNEGTMNEFKDALLKSVYAILEANGVFGERSTGS